MITLPYLVVLEVHKRKVDPKKKNVSCVSASDMYHARLYWYRKWLAVTVPLSAVHEPLNAVAKIPSPKHREMYAQLRIIEQAESSNLR